jgi:hypothetical protein
MKVGEFLLLFSAESFVFQFATKNLKIKIYRTIILPVVCVGVKLGRSYEGWKMG